MQADKHLRNAPHSTLKFTELLTSFNCDRWAAMDLCKKKKKDQALSFPACTNTCLCMRRQVTFPDVTCT